MSAWLLGLTFAWAQAPAAPPLPEPVPLAEPAPTGVSETSEEEVRSPDPWRPPEDPALREAEGQPMLGPWPDTHLPDGPIHRAWPLIDVVSGEVLQPGRPYGQAAETLGPHAAPEVVFDQAPLPSPVRPTPSPQLPETDSLAAPESPPPKEAPPLLPQPPEGSPVLALFWLLVALTTTTFARSVPGMVNSLGSRGGFLPQLLRAGGLTARVVAMIASVLTALYVLPPGARSLVPWTLVGLSLALGLASWSLFRDLLALVVLSLERRLLPGRQVRIGELAGEVVSQSPRALTLKTAAGSLVTVPNWRFLSDAVHLDVDPRALVEVRLRVPAQAQRQQVHRVLEELVLLSPYAVTRGRPSVRPDPDDPTAWWVEARLLNVKWARAFERTLVELSTERLQS